LREVAVYTRAADNRRMAGQAMMRLTETFGRPNGEQKLPNSPTGFGNSGKKANKFIGGEATWRPRQKAQPGHISMTCVTQ